MLMESPALGALRKNYTQKGINACEIGSFAGERWLRDSVWSLLWATKSGNREDLFKTRQVIDDFLQDSPNVPLVISEYNHIGSFFGIKIPEHNKRHYEISKGKSILNPEIRHIKEKKPRDSFLILMLAGNYLSSPILSSDEKKEFWEKHELHIKSFLNKHLEEYVSEDSLLLKEFPFSTRRDCLKISGISHQTNVYWYKTITDLAKGAEMYDQEYSEYLRNAGEKIKENTNNLFWHDNHYLDWIDEKGKSQDYFDPLGDFWAIVSGMTTPEQTDKILDYVALHEGELLYGDKDNIRFFASSLRPFKKKHYDGIFTLFKRISYWNNHGKEGVFWPEITLMYAAALKKGGRDDEAQITLNWMDKLLQKDQTFYEIYGSNAMPFNYTKILGFIKRDSPKSFSMALGLYLWVKSNWEELGIY